MFDLQYVLQTICEQVSIANVMHSDSMHIAYFSGAKELAGGGSLPPQWALPALM